MKLLNSSSSFVFIVVLAPLFILSLTICLFGGSESRSLSNSSSVSPVHSPYSLPSTIPMHPISITAPLPTVEPNEEDGLVSKKFSKIEKVEHDLAKARASIRDAILNGENRTRSTPLHEDANDYKTFKIFVYNDGEPPLFHDGPCKSIYSTEGRFIHQTEQETRFRTYNPDEAHVYFLPFSVVKMVSYLYIPETRDRRGIKRAALDYVNILAQKYPYWNRSLGGDHFMLSCHDWGPEVSFHIPNLYNNSIRVLCNSNTSEGFNPSRDVSFPEIYPRSDNVTNFVGGPPPSKSKLLAFYAGGIHGYVRSVFVNYWKDKGDEDIKVYTSLPKKLSYLGMMKKSKYCICPSGYEVASPRVVEAIYAECVPVLNSDHYIPPFSDVLNWDAFSIQVPLSDVPNLTKILTAIPEDRYIKLQRSVKQVQRHFIANNGAPNRYDVFHMTLHSIWLRRLNIRVYD
ncbi:hypothetical protein MKW98_009903 [Papaver atlanticum]|uniref:Exostosin GT47 domain-containing protein n=1 Tax=Papaver atlanticum TaxID=357466 RepID=A0AAD4T391_9MAGN|nr:hypothetical protein MKW98_009903 [Papaver atlanticum]